MDITPGLKPFSRSLLTAAVMVFLAAAVSHARCACPCVVSGADSPAGTYFAEIARHAAQRTLDASGCETGRSMAGAACEISVELLELKTDKKVNPIGLLFAGGLSSATYLEVAARIRIEALSGGATVFSKTAVYHKPPHELFSGFHKSRGVKKRAVQEAAFELAADFLAEIRGPGFEAARPDFGNSDMLTEDRDVWPVLGGGLTGLAIHETGHIVSARLTGHDPEIRGNDSRTFNTGPELVAGLSVLFAHHLGEDSHLPLLPDIVYDFHPVRTPRGMLYVDENGMPVSHGRRDHAFIVYSGIMYQNAANEYILTKHPHLIDRDDP